VFQRDGFDAFVGNPPYSGGSKISGVWGNDYRDYLVRFIAEREKSNADLCGYFVLKALTFGRPASNAGFVTTSAVGEGVTREVVLERVCATDAIYRANTTEIWPGAAGVTYLALWIHKGIWKGECLLDEIRVERINAFLSEGTDTKPFVLRANEGIAYMGVQANGQGFVLNKSEAASILAKSDSSVKF